MPKPFDAELPFPMPWALTGIVSASLVGLSGFWIGVILCNYDIRSEIAADSLAWDVAGIALALAHIVLLAVAVFWRRQWAVDTVIALLALESWLLVINCFPPALIFVALAAYTFTVYLVMDYWRYKVFDYPSPLFIFLEFFKNP